MSPLFSSDEEAGSIVGEITPEDEPVICSVWVGTTVAEGTSAGFFLFKKNKTPKVTATTPTPTQTAIKTFFDIKKSIS